MIVILCNSFEDVQDGFARFLDYLETYESGAIISDMSEYAYYVVVDDIQYVFTDYRFGELFQSFDDGDIGMMYLDEFFEDIDGLYWVS